MIRDITIGQFYPVDSVIHRLDPRLKLTGTFAFIIMLFTFQTFIGYIVAGAFLFGVIRLSRVPLSYILKGLKSIFFLLLFTVAFNIFLTPGKVMYEFFDVIKITDNGLLKASFMGIRLVFLIIGSSLMTFTTTPNHLTDGLERIMNPLRKIHVPVHEIAMMMSIALRFIPILLEETDKIMKAQAARGADFESGGIIRKAKGLIPILVPLFVSAFRRANDLALAMEARCYNGGEGRTKMKPLTYKKRDFIGYIILLLYIIILIVTSHFILW